MTTMATWESVLAIALVASFFLSIVIIKILEATNDKQQELESKPTGSD